MKNEQQKFLDGLDSDQDNSVDILEQPLGATGGTSQEDTTKGATGATAQAANDDDDELDLDNLPAPKNRHERRLMRKIAEEKQASAFLAGKLEARTEAERAVTEESDYLKSVERIYGTDTPEAQLATDLLKKAIVGAREDAKRMALEEVRAEQKRERDAEREAENTLNGFVDDIEDTYGVTLTEGHQTAYFKLLQKMSPKDRSGNIVDYADPHAVWEVFQDKLKAKGTGTNNRVKDMSARSMTQSGASKDSTLVDDASTRFLKENGII